MACPADSFASEDTSNTLFYYRRQMLHQVSRLLLRWSLHWDRTRSPFPNTLLGLENAYFLDGKLECLSVGDEDGYDDRFWDRIEEEEENGILDGELEGEEVGDEYGKDVPTLATLHTLLYVMPQLYLATAAHPPKSYTSSTRKRAFIRFQKLNKNVTQRDDQKNQAKQTRLK